MIVLIDKISLEPLAFLVGLVARVVHLEDEGTVLDVDLAGVKSRAVTFKAPAVALLPPAGVESVEVVLEVWLELASLSVVLLDLDIVVARVPGHSRVVEVVAPAWESRRPEVHHEVLALGEEMNVGGALSASHHVAVDEPLDVVGGPLDDVVVPVCAWLEARTVGLVLLLPLPDDVHAHGVRVDGRNQLDVDLVPALLRPVRTIPVREEGRNGAWLARALHPDAVTSIGERFPRLDFTTLVVGAGHGGQKGCSHA